MKEQAELRNIVESERSAWLGQRWRCSQDLLQQIVETAKVELAGGSSLRKVAREIGIPITSLERWLAATPKASIKGFREVELTPGEAKVSSNLVLITPGGCRVEGLKVEQLVTLLASLG
jgi:hypothetical protein